MRRRKRTARWPIFVFAALTAIAAAEGVAASVRAAVAAGTGGLALGDIVSFDDRQPVAAPASPRSAPLAYGDVQREIRAQPVTAIRSKAGGGTCVLDPATMAAGGGSFVIEGRDAAGAAPFRIHWRGAATSAPGTDCGGDAELMLGANAIYALAMDAGGFGVGQGKRPIIEAPSFSGNIL